MNKTESEIRINELEIELYNLKSELLAGKELEQFLKENNDRYLSLSNTINGYFALVNLDTLRYEFVNDSYAKSTGIPIEKIIGSHMKDVMGESNYQFALKHIDQIRLGKSVSFENCIYNGAEKRYIEAYYAPVTDANGRISSFSVLKFDITGRKQNELLLSVQNRLSKIFLSVSDFEMFDEVLEVLLEVMESPFGYMGYIDVDGAYITPTMSRQIWWEDKVINKTLRFPRDEWKNSAWAIALREKRTLYSNEPLTNLPEGHVKIQRHISHPILFKGEPIGLIQVANKETEYTESDIQNLERISDYVAPILNSLLERKQAEKELKESETKLHRLNKDKDRFISILSHDLINPFNALLGFSEILSKNVGQYRSKEIEEYAKIIHNSAKHTFFLLEDILRWANAQAGKIDYKPQKLNFSEIYKNIVYTLAPNAKAKNITIESSEPCPVTLFADLDMINLVFRNLVSNAIKFTHKGGRIEVSAKADPENIILCVSDNGIGIKPDHLEKFFDISQVFTTTGTANETGTGLGLILCKEFVEKHGGTIHVESEWGKGSKFFIHLPVADQANVV